MTLVQCTFNQSDDMIQSEIKACPEVALQLNKWLINYFIYDIDIGLFHKPKWIENVE